MSGLIGKTERLLNNCDIEMKAGVFLRNMLLAGIAFAFGISALMFRFFGYPLNHSLIAGAGLLIIFAGGFYAVLVTRANRRIAEIEAVLPDFLSLMSSNLRSGLTPDRAFILSVRSEFGPLEKEIDFASKEIVSGKPFTVAFQDMARRIDSEIFAKSVRLIIEGVRSGGHLAELLENTSLDIRRFGAVRKEIVATVRVYELFIIAAATIGAPLLYGVSSFLVDLVSEMRESLNLEEVMRTTASQLPIFTGGGELSAYVVLMFSIAAIVITVFFGALAAGVISRGKESAGYLYIPTMIVIAFAVFFGIRFLLKELLQGLFFF